MCLFESHANDAKERIKGKRSESKPKRQVCFSNKKRVQVREEGQKTGDDSDEPPPIESPSLGGLRFSDLTNSTSSSRTGFFKNLSSASTSPLSSHDSKGTSATTAAAEAEAEAEAAEKDWLLDVFATNFN